MQNNPYEILGLDKDATPDEITAAYKAKAKEVHPDKGGSTEEFAKVKSASLILLDPKKRSRFDRDGFLEEDKPDIDVSTAMERIGAFFINSINATLDEQNKLDLNQLDLVQGAKAFFDQQANQCHVNIAGIEKQVRQFDRVVRRLKTNRKNDMIKRMLENHSRELKGTVEEHKDQIRVCAEAQKILNDYEFLKEPSSFFGPRILFPNGSVF